MMGVTPPEDCFCSDQIAPHPKIKDLHMQWILQRFEDTEKLSAALDRLGIAYSWHKVIPFVGEIVPEPEIADPNAVILFGSYSLWRIAQAKKWSPGIFTVQPFLSQHAWKAFLLNGNVRLLTVRAAAKLATNDTLFLFARSATARRSPAQS
jgi:hypothetical protein